MRTERQAEQGAPTFFRLPPLRRIIVLLVVGVCLVAGGFLYRAWRRPAELSREETVEGLAKLRDVIERVRGSEFGETVRGKVLVAQAEALLEQRRIRFSAGLDQEALYWKERGRPPILYIGVSQGGGRIIWPTDAQLAQRVFHEALHGVVGSSEKSLEEECDAFCAAEEAAAAVDGRPAECPVPRDGRPVWEWVQTAYPDTPADPAYRALRRTPELFDRFIGRGEGN